MPKIIEMNSVRVVPFHITAVFLETGLTGCMNNIVLLAGLFDMVSMETKLRT